jgi:hypothetical protein
LKNLVDDEPAETRQRPGREDAARVEVQSRVISSMSITEIGPHLREVALRCIQLARESAGTRAAQELEVVSIELADRATSLEATLALLNDPDNDA